MSLQEEAGLRNDPSDGWLICSSILSILSSKSSGLKSDKTLIVLFLLAA